MVNYVNTVLVSNLATGAVLTAAPAAAASMSSASADAGKFIIMNCDPNVEADAIYNVNAGNALDIETIKVGIVTKKNTVLRKQDGSAQYLPIIKWSNEIKAADIKSFNTLTYQADTEDEITIDFGNLDPVVAAKYAEGGKRIIVRLTYKDMPHRYRKWTESYEYVTKEDDTKETIATEITNMINREWKRARVQATADGAKVILTALPYDDDDSVDSLSWANKVRFNANIYWTNPAGEGWDANNKYYPDGVSIEKKPGVQYPASAKLVRDRESWAMGYQGILNRGEGTWPIIKPAMETDLTNRYDAITLEFENMYRAADDIQRKTKQTLEIYGTTGQLDLMKAILASFVGGEAIVGASTTNTANANAGNIAALQSTVAGKADAADVTALQDAMTNKANASDVTALQDAMSGKASASDLEALAARVLALENP